MSTIKGSHHRGKHDPLSKVVRANGDANPEHRCSICGLTKAQGIERWGKNGQWDAGHKEAGTNATSIHDYVPQHRHCNRSEGAAIGNRNRFGNALGL
jgi:hypothetical protein